MKKSILGFVFCLILLISGRAIAIDGAPTSADVFEGSGSISIKEETKLYDYTNIDGVSKDRIKGSKGFKASIKNVTEYIRRLLIPIAIVFGVWGGLQLIVARTNEELFAEKRRHIYGMAVGFMLVLLATVIVDKIFFGDVGQVLTNENTVKEMAGRGASELQGLFRYATTFVVAVGVAFLIFSAIKLILAAGEREEEVSNLKKRMVYVLLGMVVMTSARGFVQVFMSTGKLAVPDVDGSLALIVNWANFILGVIGVLAVFAIVYGGIRMVTNFGIDDEALTDAKNIMKSAVIGLIVAFSAWTIMYYFFVTV